MSESCVPSEPEQSFKHHWSLDPTVTFLNHGSFGACPVVVQAYQRSLQAQLEQEPLRFFAEDYEPLLDDARAQLADFVGADPLDLVFVTNATTGINTILRSLTFRSTDELLVTNQEYNACRNALNFVAERSGASIRVADIPFPLDDPAVILPTLLAATNDRTRLLLIDHVTSQTGMILPLKVIAEAFTAQGIEVLVDGAHAPGMLPLNLRELGATYYTGNCHKWLCAPKGAGFLYVQRDRQPYIRPLVISHGANATRLERSRFHLEFDWVGTSDPSAILSVPKAIAFLGALLPGGWSALQTHNHNLALAGRHILCDALKIPLPLPSDCIGSMASLPLPDGAIAPLQTALWQRFHIQVPLIPWHQPNRLIRISAQLYNRLDEYNDLAQALTQLLAEEV